MRSNLEQVLRISEVRRSFNGAEVLKGVSLTVAPGEIKALLGPNGAGKTTLSKIAGAMLLPDSGSVTVAGIDVVKSPKRARALLGLVTGGDYGFYNRATALDNLLFFADLQGVPSRERRSRAWEVLKLVQLTDSADKKVNEYSRGMKQRLHLARGLLHRPPLLILDEVTAGLDPDIARDVRELIREIANKGTAVLLTTHLLGEVQQLCDSVDLLTGGKISFSGRVSELFQAANLTAVTELEIGAEHWSDSAQQQLEELGLYDIRCVGNATGYKISGFWRADPNEAAVRACLPEAQYTVTRPPAIEEAYLALVAELSETGAGESAPAGNAAGENTPVTGESASAEAGAADA